MDQEQLALQRLLDNIAKTLTTGPVVPAMLPIDFQDEVVLERHGKVILVLSLQEMALHKSNDKIFVIILKVRHEKSKMEEWISYGDQDKLLADVKKYQDNPELMIQNYLMGIYRIIKLI